MYRKVPDSSRNEVVCSESVQCTLTIIKHKEQRIGVLIDVQNLYHSAKNIHRSRVNFREILKTAVAGRKLIRAIAYVISTESGEERQFFEALTRLGIETKTKPLKTFLGGLKKADWDVGLSVDAIRLSSFLDVIVIISGDGDFAPLAEYLKNQGRQVEVIAFGRSCSAELKKEADDFVDLDEGGSYLLKH